MSGCSLHEAFPDTAKESGQVARREERAKAKRCGGPALSFLKAGGGGEGLDPDRPAERPLPPPEKLEGREGFQEKQRESELVKSLVGQQVDDVIGQKSRNTLPRAVGPAELPDFTHSQTGDVVPSYFGKGLEGMADFSASLNDTSGYTVQGAGLEKAAGSYTLPVPSLSTVWKPITPTGANTSFFEHTPNIQQPSQSGGVFSHDEKASLLHKLDTLFARLEEMESKKNEYAHAEVTMFILSGLILMFGLETVRKIR